MIAGFSERNRDPDDRWLKPWDFVSEGGRELMGRCVVVEDTVDALLIKISCYCGCMLVFEVGSFCQFREND